MSPAEAAERARVVADEVLFPLAQHTDRAALVPASNLEALRDSGLFGMQGPVEAGGIGATHAEARPAFEAVAGGCGATAFVWAQHHGAVRRVAGGDGPAREAWLPRLCDGSTLAGIGFAYLRRPSPPAAVRATRTRTGWRIDGEAPWITGWGLIDALVLMARADDGSVVTVVIESPGEHPALVAGEPQALAVMSATGTVSLTVRRLEVDERNVVGVQTDAQWRRRDRAGSALPAAAPLGIADRAIRLLNERAHDRTLTRPASALAAELAERRAAADRVAAEVAEVMSRPDDARAITPDDTDGARPGTLGEAITAGAAERDRGLDLARRATDALVAATGGRAMSLEHPAQRLSREATFYLIQAQTGELRAASLARMIDPAAASAR
jgi:alkylation response protein AidB-like acyl-CoA dehydrogenase